MRASVNARRELKTASESERRGKERKRVEGEGKICSKKGGAARPLTFCAEKRSVFSEAGWPPGRSEALVFVGDLARGRR